MDHDQVRDSNGYMEAKFIRKRYSYLRDLGILFTIIVHGSSVKVRVYFLAPEIFGTAPIYLLTTDIPENDYLSRSISFRLYDRDLAARVAQYMLLGIGGAKLLEIIKAEPDIYHLNEGHGLAATFHLYAKFKNIKDVKQRVAFTTHTPEKAGNEEIDVKLLEEMGFFSGVATEEIKKITQTTNSTLNFTVAALRMCKRANGVSKIHGSVANEMWAGNEGTCEIISITNAQNKKFWMDGVLEDCLIRNDDQGLIKRKSELKSELLDIVADQTGKSFDKNILTIVWARRFTHYKRADLILRDFERFVKLTSRAENPIQVIWAGKRILKITPRQTCLTD